jgi:sugar/nucleoside kinase (ribokinase family)
MAFDVIAIGSPLLDIVINIQDEDLDNLKFKKGSSNLISQQESRAIGEALSHLEFELSPGGSAANTLTGTSVLGNNSALLGVIGLDDYGRQYREQTENEGVVTYLHNHEREATGHSFILITPDGERTMLTHLGAALAFEALNIEPEKISNSKLLHIEAYQLVNPDILKLLFEAMTLAKSGGAKISLDLSDAGLIKHNKELFSNIVSEYVDILFANEDEALEFTGKTAEEALHDIADMCEVAVVKLGAKGSLIKSQGVVHKIAPFAVEMINTNGAGDMYAAGILHGLANGLDLSTAGAIASHVSALVVASPGARLDKKHVDAIQRYKKV